MPLRGMVYVTVNSSSQNRVDQHKIVCLSHVFLRAVLTLTCTTGEGSEELESWSQGLCWLSIPEAWGGHRT